MVQIGQNLFAGIKGAREAAFVHVAENLIHPDHGEVQEAADQDAVPGD
jgi:hypothetical protein